MTKTGTCETFLLRIIYFRLVPGLTDLPGARSPKRHYIETRSLNFTHDSQAWRDAVNNGLAMPYICMALMVNVIVTYMHCIKTHNEEIYDQFHPLLTFVDMEIPFSPFQ